jgi:hypothetical protein
MLRLKELSGAQIYGAAVDSDATRKHELVSVFIGSGMD